MRRLLHLGDGPDPEMLPCPPVGAVEAKSRRCLHLHAVFVYDVASIHVLLVKERHVFQIIIGLKRNVGGALVPEIEEIVIA